MLLSNNIFLGLDSSFSMYNANYKQSYHSKSMGAYSETLIKHIFPALFFYKHGSFDDLLVQNTFLYQTKKINQSIKRQTTFNDIKNIISNINDSMPIDMTNYKKYYNKPLRILDICFGLGYNAMLGLEYFEKCEIYSPEKDNLLHDLYNFSYNIQNSKDIIYNLIKNKFYTDDNTKKLYFLHGNALDYINKFPNSFFDIIFQDAFSSKYNEELWDIHYFKQLNRITAKNCLITTYAKAKHIIQIANIAGFKSIKYEFGSIFYK